jgi:hypothetical protein
MIVAHVHHEVGFPGSGGGGEPRERPLGGIVAFLKERFSVFVFFYSAAGIAEEKNAASFGRAGGNGDSANVEGSYAGGRFDFTNAEREIFRTILARRERYVNTIGNHHGAGTLGHCAHQRSATRAEFGPREFYG